MSDTSSADMPAGDRRREDPAAGRPPQSPPSDAARAEVEQRRSCLLVTCTIDGLDHLVLDSDETCAVATGKGTRLQALCGHRVIPERDPARHRGIACEPCAVTATTHSPALKVRGKPPIRPTEPDVYVLPPRSLDGRAHQVLERDLLDAGDSETLLAEGEPKIHPDSTPLSAPGCAATGWRRGPTGRRCGRHRPAPSCTGGAFRERPGRHSRHKRRCANWTRYITRVGINGNGPIRGI